MTAPVPRTEAMRADVCIVGAGPAGLSLARWLARAGLEVLVLEAGPGQPPAEGVDVTTTSNVGLPYSPAATRSSGVGGSSLRWRVDTPAGPGFVRLKELDPEDIHPGGPAGTGWPLGWSDLEPHYRAARALLDLPEAEPEADGPVAGVLQRRRYAFAHSGVFTRDLPAELRAHPRVRLVSDCTVTEILLGDGPGAAVRALACSLRGERLNVEARVYVLAGGAIENARLMLVSRSTAAAGVGNAHDLVGRHFMEHPHYTSGVLIPRADVDMSATRRVWDITAGRGVAFQDKYVLAPELRRREGLLNAAYKVKPYTKVGPLGFGHDGQVRSTVLESFHTARHALRTRDPGAVTAADLARLAGAAPAIAGFTARRLRARVRPGPPGPGTRGWARRVHHGYHVMVMAEQQASPLSRVRLLDERDALGVPRAALDWRLTTADLDSMVRGQRLVAADLGAVVGGRVVSTLGPEGMPTPGGGAHHMGTTRMSLSPRSGVVDPDCRVHGVANLFVAGSSVFPTGGAANPTLTILALASRLAAHLVAELRGTTRRPDGPLRTGP